MNNHSSSVPFHNFNTVRKLTSSLSPHLQAVRVIEWKQDLNVNIKHDFIHQQVRDVAFKKGSGINSRAQSQ